MFGTNFLPFLYGYLTVIALALFDPYWGIAPCGTLNIKISKKFPLPHRVDDDSFKRKKSKPVTAALQGPGASGSNRALAPG